MAHHKKSSDRRLLFRQYPLVILFILGFSRLSFAAAYVTAVEGQVYAFLSPYVENQLVFVGAQLPNNITITVSENSRLEIFCSHSFSIKVFTGPSNKDLCPGPEPSPATMRSDGQKNAPILISPRSKEISTLDSIVWAVAEQSQFRILIMEYDGINNREVFSADIKKPTKLRDKFPLYHYKLAKNITRLLQANHHYKIVVYDLNTGKNSTYDKNFDGLVRLVDKTEYKNDKSLPKKFNDVDLKNYMNALLLKEKNRLSDAYLTLNLVQGKRYKHFVKYQMSQLFIAQSVPVDFTAFELVRAINYSFVANDLLTAYMSCQTLKSLYFRLSNSWKKQISRFKKAEEFNKACPLFK